MEFGKFILSTLLSAMPLLASAQTSEALPFVTYGHDAASEALAGAGAFSTASNAWAAFDNTAAATLASDGGGAALSYHKMAASSSVYYNAALSMGSRIRVSLAASKGNGEKYPIYTGPGTASGQYFTPSELYAAASLGVRVTPELSLGFSARYAKQDLAKKVSYSAILYSASVAYDFAGYMVSAGVYNFGARFGRYNLPTSVRADAAKTFAVGPGSLYTGIKADAYILSGNFDASAGVSYSIPFGPAYVSPKVGGRFATTGCVMPSYLSAGLGAGLGHWGLDFACLLSKGPIGGTMLAGIHCNF